MLRFVIFIQHGTKSQSALIVLLFDAYMRVGKLQVTILTGDQKYFPSVLHNNHNRACTVAAVEVMREL